MIAAAFVLVAGSTPASAHGFQIVHNFTNGADGGVPPYTLVLDKKGRLLGTASQGGKHGAGIVFGLKRKKSDWTLTPLYNFSGTDGQPGWGLTLFKGSIYTNASYAEVMGGPCGSALQLNHGRKSWQSVLMHTYVQKQDGCPTGNLLLDRAGDVYGVTQDGGAGGWGSVFELSYSGSTWSQTILYSFEGGSDGGAPYSGLVFDKAGNLYGTATARGAGGYGTVFELSPSQSGWTYSVLYSFQGGNDGGQPVAGLIFDKAGNLYGAAESYGANGGGTIFELSPSQGAWTFNLLASLTGDAGPVAPLTLDSSGTVYGTNYFDGADGYGSVFKVTQSGTKWIYKDLHDFTGGSDGG
ncbi:MAG: choice-of-anchor tandem repeat GloVer-containing protein, partial [Rhizomicrobium sp.]